MRLVIFGPPGAGKGTQAQFIAQNFAIPHISTGDIFRENIRNRTTLGMEAKRYSEAGDLVPDIVTNAMVKDRLEQSDTQNGFLLDGYPRTLSQVNMLEIIMRDDNIILDAVINLVVPDDVIVQRLALRGRADDSVDTILHRLHVYHETTEPLIGYYRAKHLLKDVQGVGDITQITSRILGSLNHKV